MPTQNNDPEKGRRFKSLSGGSLFGAIVISNKLLDPKAQHEVKRLKRSFLVLTRMQTGAEQSSAV